MSSSLATKDGAFVEPVVATSGNWSQMPPRQDRENKRKPLP
jgi:hypothetical protein